MEKKMTKREKFEAMLTKYALDTEDRELIKHEIELLEKKANKDRKPTKTQLANVVIKEEILSVLSTNTVMTCTEIAKAIQPKHEEVITVNKVSAMMSQLVAENRVAKTTEKRKSYFSLAE